MFGFHHPSAEKLDPFYTAFRGSFSNLLSWQQLEEFWRVVRDRADAGWYIYAIGLPHPTAPYNAIEVNKFVAAVDGLLKHEHHEDYCGIVYVDSKTDPSFIKIFDPSHLGSSCGSSKHPPLPGWIMSLLPPRELHDKRHLPMNRQRWWQGLWEPPQERDTRDEERGV